MTAGDLRELFAFDDWALDRILGAAAALTDDQYEMRATAGSASLQSTLAHIVAEEWLWLRRCKDEDPDSPPSWATSASRETIARACAEIRRERGRFLSDLDDAGLTRTIAFRSLEGREHSHKVVDRLLHAVSHATYHRGQAAALLRQLGAVPPETDFVVFRESLDRGQAGS